MIDPNQKLRKSRHLIQATLACEKHQQNGKEQGDSFECEQDVFGNVKVQHLEAINTIE